MSKINKAIERLRFFMSSDFIKNTMTRTPRDAQLEAAHALLDLFPSWSCHHNKRGYSIFVVDWNPWHIQSEWKSSFQKAVLAACDSEEFKKWQEEQE